QPLRTSSMRKDMLIVGVLSLAVFLFTAVSDFLTREVFTGLSGVSVVVVWAFIGVICTGVAAWVVQRLSIAIVGIAALWAVLAVRDWSVSSASFLDALENSAFFAAGQIIVLVPAWWLGHRMRNKRGGKGDE